MLEYKNHTLSEEGLNDRSSLFLQHDVDVLLKYCKIIGEPVQNLIHRPTLLCVM